MFAKKQSGRSLSQQIEAMLRDAIDIERGTAFGRGVNRTLAALVAYGATQLDFRSAATWRESRYTFEALIALLRVLLHGLAPEGKSTVPERVQAMYGKPLTADEFGVKIAEEMLFRIAPADVFRSASAGGPRQDKLFEKISDDLGLNGGKK